MTVQIHVDGKPLSVEKGRSVLEACLENDIYIPHLCFMKGMDEPPASCRLCFVQVEGMPAPVPSCTLSVSDQLMVRTDTPEVRRLQRSGLQLLLSVHDVDCKNCPANKRCELQKMSGFLKVGLKTKELQHYLKAVDRVDHHPCFDYIPNRCVLCGKCIYVCAKTTGHNLLSYAGRGFGTTVHFFNDPSLPQLPCDACLACVDACPVGALVRK